MLLSQLATRRDLNVVVMLFSQFPDGVQLNGRGGNLSKHQPFVISNYFLLKTLPVYTLLVLRTTFSLKLPPLDPLLCLHMVFCHECFHARILSSPFLHSFWNFAQNLSLDVFICYIFLEKENRVTGGETYGVFYLRNLSCHITKRRF